MLTTGGGLPGPAESPARDAKAPPPHAGLLAAGVNCLQLSPDHLVEVDWQARGAGATLQVTFSLEKCAQAPTQAAESGPELERQHHTHPNVVAGR
jgi:hypothetical protein